MGLGKFNYSPNPVLRIINLLLKNKTPAIWREGAVKHERLGEGGTQPFAFVSYMIIKKNARLFIRIWLILVVVPQTGSVPKPHPSLKSGRILDYQQYLISECNRDWNIRQAILALPISRYRPTKGLLIVWSQVRLLPGPQKITSSCKTKRTCDFLIPEILFNNNFRIFNRPHRTSARQVTTRTKGSIIHSPP